MEPIFLYPSSYFVCLVLEVVAVVACLVLVVAAVIACLVALLAAVVAEHIEVSLRLVLFIIEMWFLF